MQKHQNKLNLTPQVEANLLTPYINVRVSGQPDLLTIKSEFSKALNSLLGSISSYIISFEDIYNTNLISPIYLSLKKLSRYPKRNPVTTSVISFAGNIYVFFIKDILNCEPNDFEHSRQHTNSTIRLANRLHQLKNRPILNTNEKKLLEKTINEENLSLQSIALNTLISHNIYRIPDPLQRQLICYKSRTDLAASLEIIDQYIFPEGGIQTLSFANELSPYIQNNYSCRGAPAPLYNEIKIIGSDQYANLIFRNLNDFFDPIHYLTNPPLGTTERTNILLSTGPSKGMNLYELIIQARENLNRSGLLLISLELLSPFRSVREQRKNLLLHQLKLIMPLLWDDEALKELNSINGNDLLIYSKFRFNIFTAYTLIEHNSLLEAELLLNNLLSFCKVLLVGRMLPPALFLFHVAVTRLEVMLEDIENNIQAKTSTENFMALANSLGFKIKKQKRIYPTHGSKNENAGVHFIVLEKS
jgi:hypothetical protein